MNDGEIKSVANIPLAELLDRAERAFRGQDPAQLIGHVRAIIGPTSFPVYEVGKSAETAIVKLRNFERPEVEEIQALEFVIRLTRPTYPIVDGKFIDSGIARIRDPPKLDELQERIGPYLYSIGVIRSAGRPLGTGFLISAEIVITNRHVIDELTFGSRVVVPARDGIHFGYELGKLPGSAPSARILELVDINRDFDVSLFRIETQELNPERMAFSLDDSITPKKGSEVAVIGYPFEDSRNPVFIGAVFDGKFGIKRIACGEIVDVADKEFFHDSTTLGGNSGSPVIDVDTGKLTGIHREGRFLYRNEAIPACALKRFYEQGF